MKFLLRTGAKLGSLWYYAFTYPVYKLLFKSLGHKSRIQTPLRIDGYQNIVIGNRVTVGKSTWLAALPLTGADALLQISDGATIGNFNHIYATQRVLIGRKVLTADKVYISDNFHSYERTDMPVMDQPVRQLQPVVIGDGSWIGENVCIFGASIGKNCVIGANSVVNRDVPDYSVAVGAPARVIRRFNPDSGQWERTESS